jgi:hypothetical protein
VIHGAGCAALGQRADSAVTDMTCSRQTIHALIGRPTDIRIATPNVAWLPIHEKSLLDATRKMAME